MAKVTKLSIEGDITELVRTLISEEGTVTLEVDADNDDELIAVADHEATQTLKNLIRRAREAGPKSISKIG